MLCSYVKYPNPTSAFGSFRIKVILADRQKLGGSLNFNWVIKRLTVNRQNFSQTISLESMWSSSPVLKTAGVDQLDSLLW